MLARLGAIIGEGNFGSLSDFRRENVKVRGGLNIIAFERALIKEQAKRFIGLLIPHCISAISRLPSLLMPLRERGLQHNLQTNGQMIGLLGMKLDLFYPSGVLHSLHATSKHDRINSGEWSKFTEMKSPL